VISLNIAETVALKSETNVKINLKEFLPCGV